MESSILWHDDFRIFVGVFEKLKVKNYTTREVSTKPFRNEARVSVKLLEIFSTLHSNRQKSNWCSIFGNSLPPPFNSRKFLLLSWINFYSKRFEKWRKFADLGCWYRHTKTVTKNQLNINIIFPLARAIYCFCCSTMCTHLHNSRC